MIAKRCFGAYHLTLAHDIVANAAEYHEVYVNELIANDRFARLVIMDNSCVELNAPVNTQMIKDAADIIRPNVIVLPDEYLDCRGTLDSTYKGLLDLGQKNYNYSGVAQVEFMAIPQGNTWEQWVTCLEGILRLNPIKWIGIPRNLQQNLGVSRFQAMRVVDMMAPDKKMHMFGFSDNLEDDIMSCWLAARMGLQLYGIDSNVPIRQGIQGKPIKLTQADPGPRGDWWDNPGDFNACAEINVRTVREWLYKASV